MTTTTAISRCRLVLAIAGVVLAAGCGKPPEIGRTQIKAKGNSDLQAYLLGHKPDLDQFRLRGPFAVTVKDDVEIPFAPGETFEADLYLAAQAEKAPLVIILHGLEASKELHAFQATHLASWGMHCLALQLPNMGPWIANGKTLARIVQAINRRPEIIDSRVDANKIILAGHSYGGAAVTVALAEGAPATGGILLDPAVGERDFPKILPKINKPVLLLGADVHVSAARNRDYVYRFMRSGIAEISIKDAAHEDAQFPSNVGIATEELQITFASALAAAAFSLAAAGNFDYAWNSFREGSAYNRFISARKK